jgi:urea carboxylase
VAGSVWQVHVQPGQSVSKGDTLIVMEAMKMEVAVLAEAAGAVVGIHLKPGSGANAGDTLITFRPHARNA